MSRGFVFVDESSVHHRIDHGYRVLIRLISRFKIALCKIIVNLFDVGAIFRSMTHIALPVRFCLSGAFSSLRTICQSREYLYLRRMVNPIWDGEGSELYVSCESRPRSLGTLMVRD